MTGIALPRLEIPRAIAFADWKPAYDLELLAGRLHGTNYGELVCIGDNPTLGVRLNGIPYARGLLEQTGVVALAGGEPLVDWVLRDARCESVRVLAFYNTLDTSVVSSPFLAQIRRLIVQGDSALSSPWLGPLQALRWIYPPRLDAIRMPPQLKELRIAGIARAHTLDAMLALLATTNLQILELSNLEVPIDALVHMPLRELRLTDCTLRGAEMFPAMPHCQISLTNCD